MKKTKKRPVVLRFRDHASHCSGSNDMTPLTCELIGYLVHEDDEFYRVVTWVTEDDLNNENCEGYSVLKATVVSKRFL